MPRKQSSSLAQRREAPKKKAPAEDLGRRLLPSSISTRPEYTGEARNLKLEGDVVFDVVFLANGSVQ